MSRQVHEYEVLVLQSPTPIIAYINGATEGFSAADGYLAYRVIFPIPGAVPTFYGWMNTNSTGEATLLASQIEGLPDCHPHDLLLQRIRLALSFSKVPSRKAIEHEGKHKTPMFPYLRAKVLPSDKSYCTGGIYSANVSAGTSSPG